MPEPLQEGGIVVGHRDCRPGVPQFFGQGKGLLQVLVLLALPALHAGGAELRAEGLHVPGLSDGEQEVVEQMRFIDDAHIDIEVEAALPDAYVSQQAERLKLYRELDSTKDEEALQAFESRLADRFGPLPRAAKELLNVVRLRWEAIRLGMERVKVKNGLMIVHFVGEENSPFYKSEAFMTLLQRVTQRPDRFVLKQHNNRLAMTVRNVKDVEDAYKTLQQL